MELIIPSIQYSLADKHSTSNIKIDALRLVRQILDRFKEPFVNDPAHPLHKQVSTLKVKANSVKEDELKRSALRALVARIPKAG